MLRRRHASAVVVTLLPLALIACADKTPSDPRTEIPVVRTGYVQSATNQTRAFTGVVAARVQSDMGFRVSGKILERLVDAGQVVKRGQPLMRLDPIDLQLVAHAQVETVVAAKVRAQQTADDEVRYRDLVATGAISASTYDQIKAAADAAQAQLRAAEAQADIAKNSSTYSVLLADADGVIVETLAEPGQVVAAGQTVIQIAHTGKREAIINLPETIRPSLGSLAQAKLYSEEDNPTQVKLRQLSASADRLSRTFEARYVLEGNLANAPLGSTITIEISDNKASNTHPIQVPISAILDAGKGSGVWVVEGEPTRVAWREVKIQKLTDEAALVEGNLQENEKIVTLGAHLLHDGDEVNITTQREAISEVGAGATK
ncbi:efflux RND transporter periplasmic adaptor subunit [Methylobacillus gramineus]|uniref:efflux RND transporter periplasmic adaptor subunit n=1 Tax=Methylobacillus gramineus TaxID=755169 RepID=UPI001CFFB740|nr:efflux RND transporter periplasmic adaptor subunit [Methylobacillus gramineus]MCB5185322.1 efflux RND transporter periplasmic adaptor subunit [Methylobacillus gramineus]